MEIKWKLLLQVWGWPVFRICCSRAVIYRECQDPGCSTCFGLCPTFGQGISRNIQDIQAPGRGMETKLSLRFWGLGLSVGKNVGNEMEHGMAADSGEWTRKLETTVLIYVRRF